MADFDDTLPAKGQGAVQVAETEPAGAREVDGKRPPRRRDQLDRFIVLDQLGQGGMGLVVSAYDPKLDRKIAIKLLKTTSNNPAFVEQAKARLLREAQAMAKLRHPNVVAVYDVGTVGDSVFVAMEYVDGGTLRSWLSESVPPIGSDAGRWKLIVDQYLEAGRGLEAAHAAGIIHRDFKPENVLVDRDGRPQVTDFGLAGILESDAAIPDDSLMASEPSPSLTHTGAIMGTPRYMAAEQHQGEATDERTDQFALCVAMWEALYGEMPFAGDTMARLARAVLSGRVKEPQHPAGVPRRIREALERGLRADPDERFASVAELREALEPPPSRRGAYLAIGLVAALAVGAAVVVATDEPDPVSFDELRARQIALARSCDCALVTFELPEGAAVLGVRPLPERGADPWSPEPPLREEPALSVLRRATGQWAIPAGRYVVEYGTESSKTWYAFESRGFGRDRTLSLPAIVELDGFQFVAGGEVVIGAPNEDTVRPPAVVELPPYLIARRVVSRDADSGFAAPGLFTAASAIDRAESDGNRLPTAAEWEWAALLGVGEGMLEADQWEWTANEYEPYPYARDGRELAFREAARREARGGCGRSQPCYLTPWRRTEAHATGGAQLRPARDVSPSLIGLRLSVSISKKPTPDGEPDSWVVDPEALPRIDELVRRWQRIDDERVFLSVGSHCQSVKAALVERGVQAERIWFAREPIDSCVIAVRRGDPQGLGLSQRGRVVVTDTTITISEGVEFAGAHLAEKSSGSIESLAGLINSAYTGARRVAIVLRRNAPEAVLEARARLVLDRLHAAGVAPERVQVLRDEDLPAMPCRISERDRDADRARRELLTGPSSCKGERLSLRRGNFGDLDLVLIDEGFHRSAINR